MSVAIIGGSGFIGSSITDLLIKEDIRVNIFDTEERILKYKNFNKEKLNNSSYKNNLSFYELDFPIIKNLKNRLNDSEYLIHLAYTTEPASSMENIYFDAETNILSSLKIFQEAIESGIKKIIFSSSGGTIYGNPKVLPVSEENGKRPICSYGASKLAIENYLNIFSQKNLITGISLRLGNPYGSYQLNGTTIGIIAYILNSIKKNNTLEVWGDGSIVRDYVHIDCVARAFRDALFLQNINSGSYNIGSGIGISINELINNIFELTGKKVPINYNPARKFDVEKIFLDISKFSSITRWKPEINLEQGIQKLWEQVSNTNFIEKT